jgi:S1-C subfamily serine protease
MARLVLRAAALVAAGFLSTLASAQSSIADAVESSSRALAHVAVLFEAKGGGFVRVERSSSGFVIDARGLLLTNEHLVDEIPAGGGLPGDEYWLQVIVGGERMYGARVVARDERLDLALLQLEIAEGELVPALELADGPAPGAGRDAFALGRPRGGQYFALAGVISRPCGPVALRQATLEPGEVLLTDAPPLDEIDGGPVCDRRGVALGIANTAQRAPYDVKSEDTVQRNPVLYSVVVCADAIRRAFPEPIGVSSVAAQPQASGDTAERAVRAAAGAVVSVWAGSPDARPQDSAPDDPQARKPEKGLGSGVIVSPSGLVLTDSDFAGEASEVDVLLLDGSRHRARVVRSLPREHVALLQLELEGGARVPALELGSSGGASAGEAIVVIGNPYGHTTTVSAGVLSTLEVDGRLRLGTWVHDGHRGGAVLDATGRLIGIPTIDLFEKDEKGRGESYLGAALPIDRVREWLAAELEPHGLPAAPAASDADLALRRDAVTAVVASTRDALLNVEIKAQAPHSGGFDPFETRRELTLLGQGSGVVIDASGLAITNWHVTHPTLAEDGTQRSDRVLEVTLPSGRRYVARVLATSRDDDLALIQLELPEGDSVEAVALGASKKLRRGDVVVAIGNPYGKANTVTVGILAAKDQDANIAGRLHIYKNLLQTDAAINPGNSGGALLDLDGYLVGINSAGRSGAGLAIPVERVREVFGQKLLATMGPFLGLTVEDAESGGVVVRTVDEHSPAAAAGVAPGDRLCGIDGRGIASSMEYANALLASRTAPLVRVDLTRDGTPVSAEIKPLDQLVWRLFRETGVEVAEIDYAREAGLVREASIALHRAYTGVGDGEPSRLMSGALRVVQVVPRDGRALDVEPGDLLLGAMAVVRTVDSEHAQLVRFEDVGALQEFVEPLATKEGGEAECWLLRDGKPIRARILVFKVH